MLLVVGEEVDFPSWNNSIVLKGGENGERGDYSM